MYQFWQYPFPDNVCSLLTFSIWYLYLRPISPIDFNNLNTVSICSLLSGANHLAAADIWVVILFYICCLKLRSKQEVLDQSMWMVSSLMSVYESSRAWCYIDISLVWRQSGIILWWRCLVPMSMKMTLYGQSQLFVLPILMAVQDSCKQAPSSEVWCHVTPILEWPNHMTLLQEPTSNGHLGWPFVHAPTTVPHYSHQMPIHVSLAECMWY